MSCPVLPNKLNITNDWALQDRNLNIDDELEKWAEETARTGLGFEEPGRTFEAAAAEREGQRKKT